MEHEYAVKISLTKHTHDNLENPYYWSLIKYGESWHQVAFGWKKSPEQCLSAALEFFSEIRTSI